MPAQDSTIPVFASAGLEVTGTRANVDNAEYIAHYLDRIGPSLALQQARGQRRDLRGNP